MIVDTSFEEEVVQHIEGALTNLNRRVAPYPYQIEGRIALRFWGKVVISDYLFTDEVFPPNEQSLFDKNITQLKEDRRLLPARKKRRKRIEEKWKTYCEWRRPEDVYGEFNYCVFARVEASDVT